MGICYKIKRITLKLLADVKMMLDYEHGTGGGVTRAICLYAEANNEYTHDYDKSKESSYINYLDFDNQYK